MFEFDRLRNDGAHQLWRNGFTATKRQAESAAPAAIILVRPSPNQEIQPRISLITRIRSQKFESSFYPVLSVISVKSLVKGFAQATQISNPSNTDRGCW
jgi:hypothetical protein